MTRNKVLVSLAALVALAVPAVAQISSDGGPIYINSERTESLERERKVLLVGNVDIQQGDARLRADTVTMIFAERPAGAADTTGVGSGFGQIQTMVAEGNVFYITADMKAKGDRGVYDAASDVITMTGNVALMRERDVAEGAVLRVEIGNRRTTLDGGDGRTRMVIEPDGNSGN
ncbi:LptA/OstA family protein [Hyphomonas sp.]|jgi:lipopolysaccharide export system protein LptA|uniref:LptA/OstA family protein n=1 Tax=Hyphomonas sp. TaxID=87 RepID=UPI0025C07E1A|nr:LptA/OstA family protein [Hyphomonas sp.]MEE2920673.1 LptA/OstA family protein [Pseudomonadota bacterium]